MKYKLIEADHADKCQGFCNGDIFILSNDDGSDCPEFKHLESGKEYYMYKSQFVVQAFENRDFLRDFISLNKIKTTLVSRALGYSINWLTQAMNRTDRGDLSDQELQSIMKKLHVDWTQEAFVYVKATATHAAYRTRPCVYELDKHKELLQRAFWDGLFVGLKA